MLGPPKSRDLDDPIRVSLEDLVPPSHFSRHLEQTLDLIFVRDLVRETYAGIGRPSIDPVVFFKLQLILFFEHTSQRHRVRRWAALVPDAARQERGSALHREANRALWD